MDHKSPDSNTNPFMQLPDNVLHNIMGQIDSHKDLVSTSQADQRFHRVAQHAAVEGSNVPLGALNQLMQGYELAGYHGSTESAGESLYGGLEASKSGSKNPTKQLGDGFYLVPTADRKDHGANQAAKSKALEWAPHEKGDPRTAYRVLTKGLDDEHVEKAKTGSRPKIADHPDIDAIHAPLDGGGKQLMIKPHIYDEEWRQESRDMLSEFYDRDQYKNHLDDFPVDVDPEFAEMKQGDFDDRMKGMGVQILPPSNPEGKLGPEFLNAIAERLDKQ